MNDIRKINQAKIELTSWMQDHSGKIDSWHVGQVLKSVGEMMVSVPHAIFMDCTESKESIEDFLGHVSKIMQSMLDGYEKFEDSLSDLYDRQYELFIKVEKAHKRITKKIESLQPIPDINIPYNIDKLIGLAERFQGLDDNTWNRVVELSKAFGKNHNH
jgi:hypothetical protein